MFHRSAPISRAIARSLFLFSLCITEIATPSLSWADRGSDSEAFATLFDIEIDEIFDGFARTCWDVDMSGSLGHAHAVDGTGGDGYRSCSTGSAQLACRGADTADIVNGGGGCFESEPGCRFGAACTNTFRCCVFYAH